MSDFKVIKGGKKNSAAEGQRKILITLRAIMILLIILMILFVVARVISDNPNIQTSVKSETAGDYLLSVNADSVVDMQEWNGNFIVLTNSAIHYVSKSGSLLGKNTHKYSSPAIAVAGDDVMMYDIGATSYRIETTKGVQYEGKTDQPIIDGDYSKKGVYAFSTKGDDVLSTLVVYTAKHDKLFEWKCADQYINTVALSRDGNRVAVAAANSENAALYSKLYIFSTSSQEPLAQYDFDSMIYELHYVKRNTVSVFGQGIFSLVNNKGRADIYTLSAVQENRFSYDASSGNTAILLSKYGNENSYELQVFDDDGSLLLSKQINKNVNWISCSGRYAAVAYESSVEVFNYSGETVGTLSLNDNTERIDLSNSLIYLLSSGGVSLHSATVHTEIKNPVPEYTTVKHSDNTEVSVDAQRQPIAVFTESGTGIAAQTTAPSNAEG
ncbi:MAG: hypothetical protein IJ766_02390 [Clostridia bacterium]|nr:hypothetical protein [Clostridia bacterium]